MPKTYKYSIRVSNHKNFTPSSSDVAPLIRRHCGQYLQQRVNFVWGNRIKVIIRKNSRTPIPFPLSLKYRSPFSQSSDRCRESLSPHSRLLNGVRTQYKRFLSNYLVMPIHISLLRLLQELWESSVEMYERHLPIQHFLSFENISIIRVVHENISVTFTCPDKVIDYSSDALYTEMSIYGRISKVL